MTFIYSWCLKCIEGKTLIGIKSVFIDGQLFQLFLALAALKGHNAEGHPPEVCKGSSPSCYTTVWPC